MNRVNLIGRVTHDIELKNTPSGKNYIQFSIACDNGKDENGERRPADFINCVAWNNKAETIYKYVKKGNRFYVGGKFKTDKYEGDGKTIYKSYVLVEEFEFIESKSGSEFVPSEPVEKTRPEETDFVKQLEEESDPYKDFGEEFTLNSDDLPF